MQMHMQTHTSTSKHKSYRSPYSNLPIISVVGIDKEIKEGRAMTQWVWLRVTTHLWLLVTERFPRRH